MFDTVYVVSNVNASSVSADSSQGKALDWLLNDGTNACDGGSKMMQRYVLAVFYFSTMGESWDMSTGWLSSDDPCTTWYGVGCGSFSGKIDVLDLDQNGIQGTLPSELSSLESLTMLKLFDNNFL